MTITFETKCWEKDWRYILRRGYLEKMIKNCNYKFDQKILYINNVDHLDEVKKYAQKKIDKGVIDKYVIVDEYAEDALKFLEIEKDSFKGGYYYSIAELVSIYLSETDYLLHFSSDSCLEKSDYKWIEETLSIIEQDKNIIVANANWSHEECGARAESFKETDNNFIGFGFSDQCYLIRTDDFRKPIYNEIHRDGYRYPRYGGELFEKRVDSYMRNHDRTRLTSKHVVYIHKNYPKDNFFRKTLDIFR